MPSPTAAPPSRDLDRVSHRGPYATEVTQAAAVEQARAVAEVQAAVVVAQQVPRDMSAAEAEMKDACGRHGLAQRAFYTVPNRGHGPSVHLARELGRIFGNVQYGVHELRRDDTAGMSEIQAFAWDVEKNVRSTRTFQVPHARMKGQSRSVLTDLGDIYLNNQNVGARAVRECILTILPRWFSDLAIELCQATLENGEGKPLRDRITDAVAAFGKLDVTVAQLEARLGRKRASWRPGDLADLEIAFGSIRRGETRVEDEFPKQRITEAELDGPAPAAAPVEPPPADAGEPGPDPWTAEGEGSVRRPPQDRG